MEELVYLPIGGGNNLISDMNDDAFVPKIISNKQFKTFWDC